MVSIIISSYQPKYYFALEKNIAETVGVPYEIIKIENPGLMGIAVAYNKGAKKARFENLLFLHEDVLFHTQNWGEKLIKHLEDPETGVVGVAGSDYVPTAPCGWYINGRSFLHLIQNDKSHSQPQHIDNTSQNKHSAYALDGVFLAMQKSKFNNFRFDEKIGGFHAYDIDLSLRFAKKYKNYVIGDILIEHFSEGSPDKNFTEGNILVRKKWGSLFQTMYSRKIEMDCFEGFLNSYFRYFGINLVNVFQTVRFIPWGRIMMSDYIRLAKSYYRYFKYRKYYEKKFSESIKSAYA